MVYFMRAGDGRIKIGTTEDLRARHYQLCRTCGCKMAILAVIPGRYREERAIHHRFHHLRDGWTEMFEPGDDLMEFIGTFRPWHPKFIMHDEPWLDLFEARDYLGCRSTTVRTLARQGLIEMGRDGGYRDLYRRADIEAIGLTGLPVKSA